MEEEELDETLLKYDSVYNLKEYQKHQFKYKLSAKN